ncbi:MAG: 4Fe-4S dicluster domain-containing protein [Planctomycetota bacterium]|jgi:formate hydrogenlyase subunit 6/NADH:ubiquinone oxidoreductase subunit I
MTTHYVANKDMSELLRQRGEAATVSPSETNQFSWLTCSKESCSLDALRQPRSAQSPKGFFLPPAESMGRYGTDGQSGVATETTQRVLLGVRACELRARNYLDKVMLSGEFDDPAYRARREATLIVSVDCVACASTCFCTLVGGKPFAEEGYDVNLTPLDKGFIVDVATERGAEWLGNQDMKSLSEPTIDQINRREQIRQGMTDRLREQNTQFEFAATNEDQLPLPQEDAEGWGSFAADCVECGACTNICPTCHCFYLYDQVLSADQFERVRTWDSCLLSTYHRMAGGESMKLSPRPALRNRLANRVLHKFTYSPQQYNLCGCVGCGRCVDACLGEIDIRQVVGELTE